MKAKHKHGLHIEYSPVNQAWFLMWHHEVLHVGTKDDMDWWMSDLLSDRICGYCGSNEGFSTSQGDGWESCNACGGI